MRGRLALGVFLEFRLIPVILWSFTAVTLGTALAYHEQGLLDWRWFLITLAIATLVQGFETHAVNEVYDWRSGTDRANVPRVLSGGSRVLNRGLLTMRELWVVFAASSLLIWSLTAGLALARSWLVVLFVLPGFVSGLAYTLPPIRTAYRPFAGELAGGFLGVLLCVLGGYFVQTLSLSGAALVAAVAYACVCVAMLQMHHYLDVEADLAAVPPKRTTIAYLGRKAGKAYAMGYAVVAAAAFGVLAVSSLEFLPAVACAVLAILVHMRTNPRSVESVTKNELRVIQIGTAAGLSAALLMAPVLVAVPVVAIGGYLVHLRLAGAGGPDPTDLSLPTDSASP
jgi:1,4-dihydroxy-2-naphthoate octaprenyltransferase